MNFAYNKQKIPDLLSGSRLIKEKYCSLIKYFMKIVWRLNKSQDFFLLTLLTYPNRNFSVEELFCYKFISKSYDPNIKTKVDFRTIDSPKIFPKYELIDQKTNMDVKKRISKLLNLIEIASKNENDNLLEEYKKELKFLTLYYKQAIFANSMLKNFREEESKRRKYVMKCLKNSLDKIRLKDEDTYLFLRYHLCTKHEITFKI